jgi:hypothetical protein
VRVPRRYAALVCIAALAALTSCSGSGSGDGGTTTTALTPVTTASPERVRYVGSQHVPILRRLLAAERAACGRNTIAPAPAAVARCRKALAGLSTAAYDFARTLVFLRPAPELEPIVADSIDAARPVVDTIRVYPKAECLGATAPPAAPSESQCVPLGRDVAETIALLERQLDRWKTELGVGQ